MAVVEKQVEVCGFEIFIDASGVGHSWRPAIEGIDCFADDQEEIACEILDGKQDSTESWNYHQIADRKYRW